MLLLLACRYEDRPTPSDPTVPLDPADPGVLPAGEVDPVSLSVVEAGRPNLLLPRSVAVDSEHGRVWASGINGHVVAFDPETAEPVAHALGPKDSQIFTDRLGDVFVLGADQLWRVTDDQTAVAALTPPDRVVNAAFALDDGVMVSLEGEDGVVTRYGGDGQREAQIGLGSSVFGLAATPHGVGVVVDGEAGAEIHTLDPATLSLVSACGLGGDPGLATQLSADTWLIVEEYSVSRATCEGERESRSLGSYNEAVVALSEGALVIDAGSSLANGRAWRLDVDGETLSVWQTPPHTTAATLDSESGTVWVSSEDASLLREYDEDGAVLQDIRTGEHVESAVADPDHPGRYHYTGRLSGAIGWIDLETREVTTARSGTWPIRPVRVGPLLWALDQADNVLSAYDPETLEVERSFDLDRPNNLRIFDDLQWSEDRGTFLFTDAAANELVEVDDEGVEHNAWPLAGSKVVYTDFGGRVELFVDGDVAWTVRTWDGAVARVDLQTGETTTTDVALESSLVRLQLSWLDAEGGRLVVGRNVLDAGSLEPLASLPVDQVLGRVGDVWVCWDQEEGAVVAVDGEGTELGRWDVSDDERRPEVRFDPVEEQLTWCSVEGASLSRVALTSWLNEVAR